MSRSPGPRAPALTGGGVAAPEAAGGAFGAARGGRGGLGSPAWRPSSGSSLARLVLAEAAGSVASLRRSAYRSSDIHAVLLHGRGSIFAVGAMGLRATSCPCPGVRVAADVSAGRGGLVLLQATAAEATTVNRATQVKERSGLLEMPLGSAKSPVAGAPGTSGTRAMDGETENGPSPSARYQGRGWGVERAIGRACPEVVASRRIMPDRRSVASVGVGAPIPRSNRGGVRVPVHPSTMTRAAPRSRHLHVSVVFLAPAGGRAQRPLQDPPP